MKRILFVILLLCGCAQAQYSVYNYKDEFDGYKYDRLQRNKIESSKGIICFDAVRYIKTDTSYFIIINFSMRDWLFIEPGESLVLLIDKERKGFVGNGSESNRKVSAGWIEEEAQYPLTADELRQIANAKEVKIKLIGASYFIEGKFTKQNFNNLKRFVREYVDNKKM